jgi:hypothetical protein
MSEQENNITVKARFDIRIGDDEIKDLTIEEIIQLRETLEEILTKAGRLSFPTITTHPNIMPLQHITGTGSTGGCIGDLYSDTLVGGALLDNSFLDDAVAGTSSTNITVTLGNSTEQTELDFKTKEV